MSIHSKIRFRFAPSPTGYLHIGSLRTALYNYLFARQQKGDFILRIEDTDAKRQIEGAVESLIKTLQAVGLDWNEGPFLPKGQDNFQFSIFNFQINSKFQIPNFRLKEKGKYGPYIQSKRLDIYKKYADELIKRKKAYYCFCTPKELEKMRQEQGSKKEPPMYDKRCLKLQPAEIKEKLKNKIPYVIRLKVPKDGSTKFKDLIRGEVEFLNKNIDDQILIKSDGYPTYHLANVVDDHLMGINYVIRGEEWLPSTPKHILLYQAFDWEPPQFAHLPLILNPDKSKLSKRQGDVAVEDYLAKGYLPEALINFIAFLGWNPGDEQEIFSLQKLIKEFSLEKINKSGAVFNQEKLDWLNGWYIRRMDLGELAKKCIPYLEQAKLIKKVLNLKSEILNPKQIPNSKSQILNKSQIPNKFKVQNIKYKILETGEIIDFNYLKKIVKLEQERLKRLDEIGERVKFFFIAQPEYKPELLIWKKATKKQIAENLKLAEETISGVKEKDFNKEAIESILMNLAQKTGTGELLWPFRVALTGLKGSPGPFEVSDALGKEKTLKRLKFAQILLKKVNL